MKRMKALDPNNPKRIGGVPVLHGRTSVRHNVVCIEQDCPGVFEIACSCGVDSSWTPWGAEHAEEIARLHLWIVGAPTQRVIR
jgi:hypothetical protein